ncbi:MAG: cupin domain-containing protein [Rhodospirillaceae bacterium]
MTDGKPDPATFYDRISERSLLPLWVNTKNFVPWEPAPSYDAALWKYPELRALLMEAGGIVTPEEASRRVLVLQNPALDGYQGTTRTLYACLQLILPGESAPEHRHTQSALRLIMEGEGAVTTVDGERIPMAPGDFIVTPSWTWHGHRHDGGTPMIWLDGLDNGLMAMLDTTFFEPGRAEGVANAAPRAEGDNEARWGAAMRPFAGTVSGATSPLVRYAYKDARAALGRLRDAGDADPCHGHRMEFVNPATGAAAMPTMTTTLMLLERGFDGRPYRSTDGVVFAVVEGEGETVVGGRTLRWEAHDVFVVPSWAEHSHRAAAESVLFSFSDRVVQQKLGVWREARG